MKERRDLDRAKAKAAMEDDSKAVVSKPMSYSVCGEDLFVCKVLGDVTNGRFVEVGAGFSVMMSNTFLLDVHKHWTGIVCVPDLHKLPELPSVAKRIGRAAEFVTGNEWVQKLTGVYDYLCMEGNELTCSAGSHTEFLDSLPKEVGFRVVSVRHWIFRHGPDAVDALRRKLHDSGYRMIVKEVLQPCLVSDSDDVKEAGQAGDRGRLEYVPTTDLWVDPKHLTEDQMTIACSLIDHEVTGAEMLKLCKREDTVRELQKLFGSMRMQASSPPPAVTPQEQDMAVDASTVVAEDSV